MPFQDASVETLQLKLNLHRKLLALIRTDRLESEVVKYVVESVAEHFPAYRVAYSSLHPDDTLEVLYAKEPPHLPAISYFKTDVLRGTNFVRMLREKQNIVAEDTRTDPRFLDSAGAIQSFAGTVSRLDCPVEEEGGRIGFLSVTSPQPRAWSQREAGIVLELAELTSLMIRYSRSQEALKKNEAIFRQFADNVHAVFWMADPENNEILYVSSAYDQVWGMPRELLKTQPRSFLDAVIPEDKEAVIQSFRHQYVGPYEKTYRIRQPSGAIRWIKDRSYPIVNDQGQIFRVVGIAEDITPLREAQERLEATQAQVISNAKFAALGEMASGIAHEINNPLAVIHGLSTQLKELYQSRSGSDSMLLESLATIEKMSNRIAVIIKGLRTFSRQTDWDPMISTDLCTVIRETIALCEPKASNAGVKIQTQIPGEKIFISCRSSEISQVIINLLNNALDAVERAPKKEILLLARCDNSKIYLSVEDSGEGIEPAMRDAVFQPFFTTKEVGRGTGLGLSISKGIAEAHGGKLYLDLSAPRTRFVVELPAEKS